MGTLSKALGSLGGFVAGPRGLIDWLINSSRSFIFGTALPASCAAAASAALKALQEDSTLLQQLRANTKALSEGLRKAGWDTGNYSTPIIPVMLGQAEKALKLQARLWDAGFYAPAIRPPTVAAGSCRLRLSVSAKHQEAHVDAFLSALGRP
jgi:7-keto-8-aminopelargonate synthetase-like enzyme